MTAVQEYYLELANSQLRELWDKYYSTNTKELSQQQYDLVNKYHQKANQIVEKLSKQGWKETRV